MNKKVTVQVPNYTREYQGGKEVTFFVIHVQAGGNKWELKRRYSEFDALRKNLMETHGNIPTLPGKSLFSMKTADQFDKRRFGLESFLKKCVDRQDLFSNQQFVEFMKVNGAPGTPQIR